MNCCNEDFKYLTIAIESYLNQQKSKVQLIVSTIEGDPCISFIQEKYPSIELCIFPKSEHPGKSPQGSFLQINRALPMITGEWFCFASSNDIAQPNKIRLEIDSCIKTHKKICYSSFDRIDANGNTTNTQNFYRYDYARHLQGNFVSDCALMHKSIVDEFLPFKTEFNNYAYWDLWLRVYEKYGNVFCYNPAPTWKYRTLESSMHIKRRNNPTLMAQYENDKKRMLNTHTNG